MQAADKKRPREEKDVVVRLRPFAKLQTADDFEHFVIDILCMFLVFPIIGLHLTVSPTDEQILRKRIQELQHYRRMGLTSAADIDKFEVDVAKRVRLTHSLPPIVECLLTHYDL